LSARACAAAAPYATEGRLLLLFDIDGTLVRGRPLTHQRALEEAASEVFGLRVAPGESPVSDVEPWGKTDRQILRDVLARAGLPAPDASGLARWERLACEAYERIETEGDGPEYEAEHAATAEALGRLRDGGHLLALLTGNLEAIARRKLALRGLGDFFPPGQGGFGSDAELRPELVPIARARAGHDGEAYARAETLLIGDTPLDMKAAAADGVRPIGITGHRFSADGLRDAGAVATVDELGELPGVVGAL
jgi:phosphoglycolate phosphatase-like HAD superfamily hydrolase